MRTEEEAIEIVRQLVLEELERDKVSVRAWTVEGRYPSTIITVVLGGSQRALLDAWDGIDDPVDFMSDGILRVQSHRHTASIRVAAGRILSIRKPTNGTYDFTT